MDLQKLTFPLMIAAAIAALWVLFHPKEQPAPTNQISAAPSGLPNYMPAAQTYQVNPPQLMPSQPVVIADPYNPNPGLPSPTFPPPYLSFNFGPSHDLSKIPLSQDQLAQMAHDRSTLPGGAPGGESCGCGGNDDLTGCNADTNHGVFPDGRNAVMAKSGPELISRLNRQDPTWMPRQIYNLGGSDVTPQNTPIAPYQATQQTQPTQGATPAAHSVTFIGPSVPGGNSIATGKIPAKVAAAPFNANAVTNTVGSTDKRLEQVGTNLFVYGQQVPKLSANLVQRLVSVPMAG